MLTPRMPLYIVEMYAAILYTSTTAARRFGLPYVSEAALCGLLAHLLYHTYDINGPRYLWWTWHDADPSIGKRQLNAPIGSSMWILTYCALHAALSRWVNDSAAPSFRDLALQVSTLVEMQGKRLAGERASQALRLAETAATKIDLLHEKLLTLPTLVKIAFCGSVCTPLFMMGMGQFQLASLDVLGVPGVRTYRMALFAYLCVLLRAFALKESTGPTVVSKQIQSTNLMLFKAIACFYAMQMGVCAFGNPSAHVSTGCHQKATSQSKLVKDIMGYKREEHLTKVEQGPQLNSTEDYVFPSDEARGRFDAAGRPFVLAKDEGNEEWYTVVGKNHAPGRRWAEFKGVAGFSLLGSLLYGYALAGPFHG